MDKEKIVLNIMNCENIRTLIDFTQNFIKLSQNIFKVENKFNIQLTGSFGIAQFPIHGTIPEALIKKANIAMYEAKKRGKNCIYIFQGD